MMNIEKMWELIIASQQNNDNFVGKLNELILFRDFVDLGEHSASYLLYKEKDWLNSENRIVIENLLIIAVVLNSSSSRKFLIRSMYSHSSMVVFCIEKLGSDIKDELLVSSTSEDLFVKIKSVSLLSRI